MEPATWEFGTLVERMTRLAEVVDMGDDVHGEGECALRVCQHAVDVALASRERRRSAR